MRRALKATCWDTSHVLITDDGHPGEFFLITVPPGRPGSFGSVEEVEIEIRAEQSGHARVMLHPTRLGALNDAYRRDVWSGCDTERHIRVFEIADVGGFCWAIRNMPHAGDFASLEELEAAIRVEAMADEALSRWEAL